VSAGARLGSITGVLAFVCLLAIVAIAFAFSGNEVFQEMVKQNPEFSQAMNNTPAMILGVGLFVAMFFGIVVGICAAGGAIGARFANRNGKA
jgi:succinate dehydrogenase/fumarate reductase cytochrome b subunit